MLGIRRTTLEAVQEVSEPMWLKDYRNLKIIEVEERLKRHNLGTRPQRRQFARTWKVVEIEVGRLRLHKFRLQLRAEPMNPAVQKRVSELQ